MYRAESFLSIIQIQYDIVSSFANLKELELVYGYGVIDSWNCLENLFFLF
jgi:hypothetical protein